MEFLNAIIAIQAIRTLLQRFVDEDRSPTEAVCVELNELYDKTVQESAPTVMLGPVREAIDRLCSK